MLNGLFDASSLPVLEQVANFTTARHSVLAGNIANLDTPGYHVRDLSPEEFHKQLKQALADRQTGSAALNGAINVQAGVQPLRELRQSFGSMLRHDDANVGMERQVAEMAKNQMQHSLALTIMSSQFRLLQAAISERA